MKRTRLVALLLSVSMIISMQASGMALNMQRSGIGMRTLGLGMRLLGNGSRDSLYSYEESDNFFTSNVMLNEISTKAFRHF